MWRSLAIKASMLVVAAGAVAAMLWHPPPVPDRPAGAPTSPAPLVVQAAPLREVPVVDARQAASPDATPGAVTSARARGTAVRHEQKRTTRGAGSSVLPGERKLDLNRATQLEFERLPGIGPSLARQLVDHREKYGPYRRIEDLQKVKGIGAKRFERLMPFVTVSTSDIRPSGASRPSTEPHES